MKENLDSYQILKTDIFLREFFIKHFGKALKNSLEVTNDPNKKYKLDYEFEKAKITLECTANGLALSFQTQGNSDVSIKDNFCITKALLEKRIASNINMSQVKIFTNFYLINKDENKILVTEPKYLNREKNKILNILKEMFNFQDIYLYSAFNERLAQMQNFK